jgi:hypothetical protein
VEAIQTVFNRLIDLSGVENDAVKNRHIDFGNASSQTNAGDIPLSADVATGGTASNISSSQTIYYALSQLASLIKNLSGADDNSVIERHVDFGVSSGQIDADLLPLGTAINESLSEAIDIAFTNDTKVRQALTDIADRLSSISNQVTTNKDNISGEGSEISQLQSDFDKNENIPVGVIWMYDGANWVDDSTLPGWYACIASNADKGCPDLEDRFIKGGTTGTKGSQYGTSGGVESATIEEDNLPPHKHPMPHKHTVGNTTNKSGATDIDHTHGMNHTHNYYHMVGKQEAEEKGPLADAVNCANYNQDYDGTSGASSTRTGNGNSNHRHTVEVDQYNGNTDDNTTNQTPFSIDPQHYTVIYIRKCFQR